MQTRKIARYGWKPDFPDHRDLHYANTHYCSVGRIPESVDLKPKLALVFDQGDLGSCTANSTLWMKQFVLGAPVSDPYWSRMFLYTTSLIQEGAFPQDAGAQIRDVVKILHQIGVCPESDMPYVVSAFPEMPNAKAQADAPKSKIANYSRLTNRADFLNCLASGFPFVFGFSVFESFESETVAKTGIVPLPGRHEEMMGGHAVCCIGYDQNFQGTGKLYYLVQNSWSSGWGDPKNPGCFWMPSTYLENPNLASDYWTCRK